MTNRATIVHDTYMDKLYAKVVFDLKMSEGSKSDLIKSWKDFKDNVDEAIKNIEGVPFK